MELRETFNTVAELYDLARPGYPDELYDDLRIITGLGPGAEVLEIAPGTGKATVELARRGYRVTGVELGPELAAVARRNLAAFPGSSIEVSGFEEWDRAGREFDLVCCATGFAWLDPDVRIQRCAEALRPGGYLAIWGNEHVDGGTSQFFPDSQEWYERWMPGTPPGLRCEPADEFADKSWGVDQSADFESPEFRRYFWTLPYTTKTYLDVLRTYSGHIALEEPNRSRLYACIGRLIDSKYGGRIEKAYLTQLTIARRT